MKFREAAATRSGLVMMMAVLLMLVWADITHAHNHEEYYRDLRGHWARAWIDVLWSEGVTDGFRIQTYSPALGWYRESRFLPDRQIRLDAWTVLAAKVFDLTPAPSARAYWLESGQEVSRLLATAQSIGWVQAPYNWTQTVSREVALRFLVKALDLDAYSESLSDTLVIQTLAQYRDRHQIDSAHRRYIAAATRLGIVEGYPDGTFRPRAAMTRAEAATMLARSALARAEAWPNPFFPDGDGIDDHTDFRLTSLRNRNISRWELTVEDYNQRQLWATGTQYGRAPSHPASVQWGGSSSSGNPLPPGEYYYQFTVWDLQGQEFSSVRKPLRLDWRRLQGGLDPVTVQAGSTLAVWGQTWGDAQRVDAQVPGLGLSSSLRMQRRGEVPLRWQNTVIVPDDAPPGPHTLNLKASFQGAIRTVYLTFYVIDRAWLEAHLEPTVLPAGSLVTVHAETSDNVTSVTAHFPGGESLALTMSSDHNWHRTWRVPLDTPQGTHDVWVVADSPYGPREARLEFTVAGDVREEVQTILTD